MGYPYRSIIQVLRYVSRISSRTTSDMNVTRCLRRPTHCHQIQLQSCRGLARVQMWLRGASTTLRLPLATTSDFYHRCHFRVAPSHSDMKNQRTTSRWCWSSTYGVGSGAIIRSMQFKCVGACVPAIMGPANRLESSK